MAILKANRRIQGTGMENYVIYYAWAEPIDKTVVYLRAENLLCFENMIKEAGSVFHFNQSKLTLWYCQRKWNFSRIQLNCNCNPERPRRPIRVSIKVEVERRRRQTLRFTLHIILIDQNSKQKTDFWQSLKTFDCGLLHSVKWRKLARKLKCNQNLSIGLIGALILWYGKLCNLFITMYSTVRFIAQRVIIAT